MELVASEPVIRQPIDLHFDERGRLWVVQYLQYPFPAGLAVSSYDQYLRARYTGVPPAPPNHVRGADKITVLEDTDGDGVFDSHKDVITGLNITTSVLTGRGGVWVMNPPYLLFYRDRTGDGLPDGDPEVRLQGFGLEDTHSLANSLTWGPDGWLYGVHGSTSTANVRGITFLGQAVWRYHPERDTFELFAEGGGNPWTLSFDSKGRAFSGDNGGNSRGFHWVQGGRYEKNWPKHGPFTRPHSYGHISNMDHEGYAARFAMTSVVYEDGKLPGYEGQLISGMALTSRMQATRFVADGSTFRTVDTDAIVTTADRSFRPVDTAVGPDGAIYIADWCDIRMDHTDPRDTWDKSCGRIWRLRASGSRPIAPFNLARRSSQELVELLGDKRKWYREQARRRSPTATVHSCLATAESCPSRPRSSSREIDQMTTFERPMPVKTPTSAPFWDALSQHRIRIQYSPSTDAWVFYPRVRAPRTLANDLEWREISGMGTLYSFTVARRPVGPHFADAVPQLLAIVEWDEGPRFSTEMVNVDPADLRIGMRVRPVFFDYPDHDVTMVRYEPADAG